MVLQCLDSIASCRYADGENRGGFSDLVPGNFEYGCGDGFNRHERWWAGRTN